MLEKKEAARDVSILRERPEMPESTEDGLIDAMRFIIRQTSI